MIPLYPSSLLAFPLIFPLLIRYCPCLHEIYMLNIYQCQSISLYICQHGSLVRAPSPAAAVPPVGGCRLSSPCGRNLDDCRLTLVRDPLPSCRTRRHVCSTKLCALAVRSSSLRIPWGEISTVASYTLCPSYVEPRSLGPVSEFASNRNHGTRDIARLMTLEWPHDDVAWVLWPFFFIKTNLKYKENTLACLGHIIFILTLICSI